MFPSSGCTAGDVSCAPAVTNRTIVVLAQRTRQVGRGLEDWRRKVPVASCAPACPDGRSTDLGFSNSGEPGDDLQSLAQYGVAAEESLQLDFVD